MRPLLMIALWLCPRLVHADLEDARHDIVDMRHGREPSRIHALGWTDTGSFVLRRTECTIQDLSDIPSCTVSIEVTDGAHTTTRVLFAKEWEIGCAEQRADDPRRAEQRADDPRRELGCWTISYPEASRFLATERQVLKELGPLQAGIAVGPELPGGRIIGVRFDDAATGRRRAAIALYNIGRWRPLRVIWSVETGKDQFLRRDPSIDYVEQSPDGSRLAIVSTLAFAELDFYWECHGVDVLPRP